MTEEYAILTRGAGLVERSDRARLRLTGADRKAYLQGQVTNDVEALTPGSGCYAAMLTPQGRMIADMRVLDVGEALLLDVDASLAPMLRERFEQFIFTEDVAVTDVSGDSVHLSVVGPKAWSVISAAAAASRGLADGDVPCGEPQPSGTRIQVSWVQWGTPPEPPVLVVTNDDFGVPGFDLYVPRGTAGTVGGAVRAAGAVPVGGEALEVLRIEAGRPAFLRDMDTETIPLEAGIEERAISQAKGCYVGQEIIVRVLHRGGGRVARRLVGLLVDGEVPSSGDALRSGDREIGRITSAAQSPALGRPIALGYVHRDFTAPGTRIEVRHGSASLDAAVAALPFVRRQGPAAPPSD